MCKFSFCLSYINRNSSRLIDLHLISPAICAIARGCPPSFCESALAYFSFLADGPAWDNIEIKA